jgi:hypothetical protein
VPFQFVGQFLGARDFELAPGDPGGLKKTGTPIPETSH